MFDVHSSDYSGTDFASTPEEQAARRTCCNDDDDSEPPHIRAFIGFGVSCIAGIAFYLAIWAVLVR